MAFGDLLHDILNEFGKSELNRSSDEDAIYAYLESHLQIKADKSYGKYSYGVIPIQLSQLRNRLFAFSRWQAAWISDGWEMVETEFQCNPGGFTVLASDRPDVVENSIEEFEYHADIARYMGYGKQFQDFKLNVHISGRQGPAGIKAILPRLSQALRRQD